MDGQMTKLREWAKGRAREAAAAMITARHGRRMVNVN
jgi:hypothetical protein